MDNKPTIHEIAASGLIMARYCANGIGQVEAVPEAERGDLAIAILREAHAEAVRLGFVKAS